MRVSKRTDYALRVLFHLLDARGQGPLSISALAKRNDIPKRFLEQIMIDLRTQGWVSSTPGRYGGYVLAHDPEKLTMGQVVRYFDGVLAPIGCVSVSNFAPCSQSPTCKFRRIFLEVRNATAKLMDAATLARVAAGRPVTREEVFDPLLFDGAGI